MPHVTLAPGDRGVRDILTAKKLLVDWGKRHGHAHAAHAVATGDPWYGPQAVALCKLFQQANKIEADGVIGPHTWSALDPASAQHAHAAVGLVIASRRTWNAKPPKSAPTPTSWTSRTPVRVHHSADVFPSSANVATEIGEMLTTQRFHQSTRGWNDIAYNYVVMPSGRVYEGRGANVVGAHTLDHNHDCGICFAGNFDTQRPTDAALKAYGMLLRHLGLDRAPVYPHCASFATACPGRHLRDALKLRC